MSNKNQTTENCNLCGTCNLNCPIYITMLKEPAGARHKVFLAKNKKFDEIFFLCTDCRACIQDCPASINLKCLKIRQEMAEQGIETPANKVMKDNIKHSGNPFGITKKGAKIKQYYT